MNKQSPDRYDLWVGSELGLLKGVTLRNDSFTNYGDIKLMEKSKSITCMCKYRENDLLIGLRGGNVREFDTKSCEYTNEFICSNTSQVNGIIPQKNGKILTCTESGVVQLWKNAECTLEKSVGDDIRTMVGSSQPELFATGGLENDIKIWKLDALDKPIFAAKNVRNDFLNLRVPVWVSAIEFFRGDINKVCVGSGHHSIRVYDRRDKRRPVIDTDWHEHPITALSIKRGNTSVVIGNSAGFMAELDLRNGKQIGGFKGNAGSIRSIVCHPTQPYVLSAGLDRFLKVYDITSRKLLKKIYMKSNLNCMLLSDGELKLVEGATVRAKRDISENSTDDSKEEIWNKLDTVPDKKKKKSKKKKT